VGSLEDATLGEVVQRMDYDEYGVVLTDTAPGFQPFGFAGGMYDKNTTYIKLGQRDYSPVFGKWTRKEPIPFIDGVNTFTYSLNSPVSIFDISGLLPTRYEGTSMEIIVNIARSESMIVNLTISYFEASPELQLSFRWGERGRGSTVKGGNTVSVDPCDNPIAAIVHEIGSMFHSKFLSGLGRWQPAGENVSFEGARSHNFGEMINKAIGRDPKWIGNNSGFFWAGYNVNPYIWQFINYLIP